MTYLRRRMLEDLQRRNYSDLTIRSYVRHVAEFAKHFHRSPDQLGAEHLRQYQLFLIRKKKLAWPSYNQIVAALRFFYVKTLRREFLLEEIPFPRAAQRLPVILSPAEVAQFSPGAAALEDPRDPDDYLCRGVANLRGHTFANP